jgi:hypothetical protein
MRAKRHGRTEEASHVPMPAFFLLYIKRRRSKFQGRVYSLLCAFTLTYCITNKQEGRQKCRIVCLPLYTVPRIGGNGEFPDAPALVFGRRHDERSPHSWDGIRMPAGRCPLLGAASALLIWARDREEEERDHAHACMRPDISSSLSNSVVDSPAFRVAILAQARQGRPRHFQACLLRVSMSLD